MILANEQYDTATGLTAYFTVSDQFRLIILHQQV